jgi:hypothetical protein
MWPDRQGRLLEFRRNWGNPIARERRLDAIEASHRSRAAITGARTLDDRAWVDLDLDEVFVALDRTTSTLGQHALYHRMRTAPAGDHLDEFEALVERLRADAPLRERAQGALSRLKDPHGYDVWWLGASEPLEPQPWYSVFPLLTAVTLTLALGAIVWHVLLAAFVLMVMANLAVRFAIDERTTTITRSVRQLAPLIAAAQSLRFVDDAAFHRLTGALAADVAPLARLKQISRWTNGNPFMLSFESSWLAVTASDVVEIAYEYLNSAFLLDATGVYFALKDLAAHRHALLRVVSAAGEIDAAIAVASFRAGGEAWTRPRFTAPGSLARFDDVRHPLLEAPVPNSIVLHAGKGVLVTGSNMSGKSTFLRTIGVNVVLAQTIATCLASRYEAPMFSVRSCIGRSDDLVGGKSYYLAEVEALLGLVRAGGAGEPCLFLLDEMFRGTNASERIAAGEAVLRELVAEPSGHAKAHVSLAATHDGELVDLLAGIYEPMHFGDAIGPEGLVFDHRLREGPATTRNAIALLRLSGAPASLVERATASADRLDRERGVTLARR